MGIHIKETTVAYKTIFFVKLKQALESVSFFFSNNELLVVVMFLLVYCSRVTVSALLIFLCF